MGTVNGRLHGTRRRSVLAALTGGFVASIGLFLALAAVADIAQGAELSGPVGGGIVGLVLLALGVLLLRWGRRPVHDFDDALKVHTKLVQSMGPDSEETRACNDASRLMLEQRFEEALAAWTTIASTYPSQKAEAYSQIGVAHHFLNRFEEAIGWYEKAEAEGYPADMSADNIRDAREAMAKQR